MTAAAAVVVTAVTAAVAAVTAVSAVWPSVTPAVTAAALLGRPNWPKPRGS